MNKMKLTFNLVMVWLLACGVAHSQDNFELSLKTYSLEPDYKTEQIHTLVLENTSKSSLTFQISVENISCAKARTIKQSDLEHQLLHKNAGKSLSNTISINPNESFEFSLKIIKPSKVVLGSTNCSQVIARTVGSNPVEKSLIITSYIPDPKTDN